MPGEFPIGLVGNKRLQRVPNVIRPEVIKRGRSDPRRQALAGSAQVQYHSQKIIQVQPRWNCITITAVIGFKRAYIARIVS